VKKSTTAFVALLEAMNKRQKAAICVLTARANAAPRLCALLPQMEVRADDGIVDQPAGLSLVQLPFADDIRSLQVPPAAKPSPELIRAAKQIVARVHVDSLELPDPALQTHYANLHVILLSRVSRVDLSSTLRVAFVVFGAWQR
jgi:ATP-dependent DNA helicase 2 subunit 1